MLVFSRKKDEEIVIRDDIVIKVVEIRGDKARLGFEAPKEVSIYRQEVYEYIRRDNIRRDKIAQCIGSGDYLKAYDILSKSPYPIESYKDSVDLPRLAEGLREIAKSLETKLK